MTQTPEIVAVLFSFLLNCIILVLLMLFSRKSLERIRKVIGLLSNGGWRDCPKYYGQRSVGRRWYDENNLPLEEGQKGGEEV